ncbi:hypothetical protein PTKIN_Ptkin01aG0129700 [Pterospermum kingtungense]
MLARLAGVQNLLAVRHNKIHIKLEKKIRRELDDVLRQEELFWFQKSREEWFHSRDLNTKFYHASTLVKRSRNKVDAFQDHTSTWVVKPQALKCMAYEFFNNLFAIDAICDLSKAPKNSFPILPEELLMDFLLPFTAVDIK